MVYRTIERKADLPYRDAGGPIQGIRDLVFVGPPRTGSFAITLRLGYRDQLPLPTFDQTAGVLDEIMLGVHLVNEADEQRLVHLIPNEAYRHNFIGLAKKIAPDGERVSQVGFTQVGSGKERAVQLTRLQDKITISVGRQQTRSDDEAEQVQVVGALQYADARKSALGLIKLVDRENKEHNILVPTGWMADIVQPYWQDQVIVTGIRRRKFRRYREVIELTDIDRAEEPGAAEEGTKTP